MIVRPAACSLLLLRLQTYGLVSAQDIAPSVISKGYERIFDNDNTISYRRLREEKSSKAKGKGATVDEDTFITTDENVIVIDSPEPPSPWPTYFPTNFNSELPTSEKIATDSVLIFGERSPNCPPLLPKLTNTNKPTPKPSIPTRINPITLKPVQIPVDTLSPTKQPNTPKPIPIDSLAPTDEPSREPSKQPTSKPTPATQRPSPAPSKKPGSAPTTTNSEITFRRGDLKKDIQRFGIKITKGMSVRYVTRISFHCS
jgi:hypothetical protein